MFSSFSVLKIDKFYMINVIDLIGNMMRIFCAHNYYTFI